MLSRVGVCAGQIGQIGENDTRRAQGRGRCRSGCKAGPRNPCARWVVGGGAFAITLSPASESALVLAIITRCTHAMRGTSSMEFGIQARRPAQMSCSAEGRGAVCRSARRMPRQNFASVSSSKARVRSPCTLVWGWRVTKWAASSFTNEARPAVRCRC